MTRRNPETSPPAFLGAELRRARMAAGFSSQEPLAARLGFDRSVVAKAETGERPPTDDVLTAWCQACRLDDDLFGRLAVLARRADGPLPTWFEDWPDLEAAATTLRWFEPLLVSGLLQTEMYARALYATRVAFAQDDIDSHIAARLRPGTTVAGQAGPYSRGVSGPPVVGRQRRPSPPASGRRASWYKPPFPCDAPGSWKQRRPAAQSRPICGNSWAAGDTWATDGARIASCGNGRAGSGRGRR